MKIYTRTGDDGGTSLIGPGRVSKSSPRIAAYGDVDELNAHLGLARTLDRERWLEAELGSLQPQLFQIGAELATTAPEALAQQHRIGDADVEGLERLIDRLDADLPKLIRFVLPHGTALAAQLHVARTVCRRAERSVVALGATDAIEPRIVHFLNRLADLLFVMARWANHRAGVAETEWAPGPRGHGDL